MTALVWKVSPPLKVSQCCALFRLQMFGDKGHQSILTAPTSSVGWKSVRKGVMPAFSPQNIRYALSLLPCSNCVPRAYVATAPSQESLHCHSCMRSLQRRLSSKEALQEELSRRGGQVASMHTTSDRHLHVQAWLQACGGHQPAPGWHVDEVGR